MIGPMRITVFGASGATGRELVAQALAAGHQVTAFVRTPAKLTVSAPTLARVQGDVTDATAVARAIAGSEAVFVALGAASPLKLDTAITDGMRHILAAMHDHGVRRLLYLSFIGVRESREEAGWFVKHIAVRLLANEVAGHEAREAMIKASATDFTIVRAPKLFTGARQGPLRHGEHMAATSPFAMLSRADLAAFLLGQLSDTTYIRHPVTVMP